ncbi:unnamed protein product [Cyclocybe aegerita]|uniref:UBA domain-containing protein n=1 Tax=Cyclocybe aegerita TaxID=1973307 RepID=A0A8S0WHS1_CYCAE|nr:unnamed protein product [Cyclocybe aegerita]
MSDSFADLWSSSASLPPKPKPQTLSSVASSSSNVSRNPSASSSYRPNPPSKPDVFALLSASNTGSSANYSSSATRYGTGTPTPVVVAAASNPASRPISALGGRSNTSTPAPVSTNASSDAFSDLFSSSKGSNGGTAGMTLAARLAMEAQQRSGSQSRNSIGSGSSPKPAEQQPANDAWAGLDSLAGGGGLVGLAGSGGNTKPSVRVMINDHDDWGLGDFGKASTSTSTMAKPPSRSTSQAAAAASKPTASKGKTLWDLDEFASPSAAPASISRSGSSLSHSSHRQTEPTLFQDEHVDSPDADFDFGGREDRVDEERRRTRKTGEDLLGFDDDGSRHQLNGKILRGEEMASAGKATTTLAHVLRHSKQVEGSEVESTQRRTTCLGCCPSLCMSSERMLALMMSEVLSVLVGIAPITLKPLEPLEIRRRGGQHICHNVVFDAKVGIKKVIVGKCDVVMLLVYFTSCPFPFLIIVDMTGSYPVSSSTAPSNASTRAKANTGRAASPPPHILGQIVEMGFSVAQARQALAQTKDGQDVQAALDSLLGGGGDSGAGSSRAPERPPERDREQPHPPPPTRTRSAPKGAKERDRERQERLRRERQDSNDTVAEIQDQADKILAQASEIGLNMFSKASAFWKEGKDKVVKVYEERTAASSAAGIAGRPPAVRTDGRPKWMQDAEARKNDGISDEEYSPRLSKQRKDDGFRDDDDDAHALPAQERRRPPRHPQPQSELNNITKKSTCSPMHLCINLLGSNNSGHHGPSLDNFHLLDLHLHLQLLARSLKHKTTGTEQFKFGQFGTAVEAYSSAITSLPPGHLLLVPLYTNRAIARIRTGEYPGAVEDAAGALVIIVAAESAAATNGADPSVMFDPAAVNSNVSVDAKGWSPAIEPPALISAASQKANQAGWTHAQGVGVDLSDGYLKALKRRAEAWEGREKWNEALKDWEILSGASWIGEGVRKEAARGAARCRRMVDGGSAGSGAPSDSNGISGSSSPPAPKPKPKPVLRPKAPASEQPSVALESLRALNSQAEADDNLKHQLKDSVDTRLASWRTGKETNIRALLASLDLVLWEEVMSGCRVKGLSDLVSAAQVKKAYMKVVARVHPDKLSPSNSTVEQRMLANGVFGTLNEAWVAFQNGKQ